MDSLNIYFSKIIQIVALLISYIYAAISSGTHFLIAVFFYINYQILSPEPN